MNYDEHDRSGEGARKYQDREEGGIQQEERKKGRQADEEPGDDPLQLRRRGADPQKYLPEGKDNPTAEEEGTAAEVSGYS